MKKAFITAVLSLGVVFALHAQTIEELPTNKAEGQPEFKITYPTGRVAYVDMHKLRPPSGDITVGFVCDFDPVQEDRYKENARTMQWNGGAVAQAFIAHLGSHEEELGIDSEGAKDLVNDVHELALRRLGL